MNERPLLAPTLPPGSSIIDGDLHLFVDGQLDLERRAIVADHLENHPAAAQRVAEWQGQNELLRHFYQPLFDDPPPPSLRFSTRNDSKPFSERIALNPVAYPLLFWRMALLAVTLVVSNVAL